MIYFLLVAYMMALILLGNKLFTDPGARESNVFFTGLFVGMIIVTLVMGITKVTGGTL